MGGIVQVEERGKVGVMVMVMVMVVMVAVVMVRTGVVVW